MDIREAGRLYFCFFSDRTLGWLKSTAAQDFKQVVNSLLATAGRSVLTGHIFRMSGEEMAKVIVSQGKNEGESLELDPNKPSPAPERAKIHVVSGGGQAKENWLNEFFLMSFSSPLRACQLTHF